MVKKGNTNNTSNVDWGESAPRLILYADFMGFKEKVIRFDHKTIKKELETFHLKWVKQLEPLKLGGYLKFVQFSDSILVVVNGTTDKMCNLISKASVVLMHVAMSMKIPVKGVIAQGDFIYDEGKQLYFGKPLVDAYVLHDKIKCYSIVVHHTAEETVKTYIKSSIGKDKVIYSNAPICIEGGEVSHYHLCWNLMDLKLQTADYTEECNEWLEQIELSVSGIPRIYVDRTRKLLYADLDRYNKLTKEKSE